MANMIPVLPRPCSEASKEKLIFETLKTLPDEYYVFHSLNFDYWGKRNTEKEYKDALHEHQADFVVFNKTKGILIIEVKAGNVCCEEGTWYQLNRMTSKKHIISPYDQAAQIKWDLFHSFDNAIIGSLKTKCKFQHAVWFVDITKDELQMQKTAADINIKRTLTHDALDSDKIQQAIDYLYSLPLEKNVQTNLTDNEANDILNKVLNPKIRLETSENTEIDTENKILNMLLNEQKNILNYLEDQKSAIISGIAGSGKTFLALEKARRHSVKGEAVLFLCYNKRLKDYLENKYSYDESMSNVKFFTIDGLSYKWCKKIDYKALKEKIYDLFGNFPFQHIIIDEGQDFGIKNENSEYNPKEICDVIQELSNVVLEDEEKNGSFYIFYDKCQLINCNNIPKYITDADCKLTLYTNCRNTANIAKTSATPVNIKNKKVLHNDVESSKPKLFVSNSENDHQIEDIESCLQYCIDNKLNEVEILTCKTVKTSVLNKSPNLKNISDDEYKYCYKNSEFDFTTCRKFKGLETQVVILVDINRDTFMTEQNRSIFYVGASRAKNRLFLIAKFDDEDYIDIAKGLGKELKKGRKPSSIIANHLDVDLQF